MGKTATRKTARRKTAARKTWQLQEAKNRLSRVVDEAVANGPQVITRRGVETAVVIGIDEYRRLTDGKKTSGKRSKKSAGKGKGTLLEFFRNSPLWGVELDIERSKDTGAGRDVEF